MVTAWLHLLWPVPRDQIMNRQAGADKYFAAKNAFYSAQ
jgi:hypothetical protein